MRLRRFLIASLVILYQLCQFATLLFSFPLGVADRPLLEVGLSQSTKDSSQRNSSHAISFGAISAKESLSSSLNTLSFNQFESSSDIQYHQGMKAKSSTADRPKKTLLSNSTTTSSRKEIVLKPAESLPYSSVIQALRAYHSIHGNLVIPRRYTIPHGSPEYPIETHNIDLASTVYNMNWWQRHVRYHTERVAELNQIGFLWERLQPEWNLVVEALITYNALHGNLLVPSSFVVPSSSSTTITTENGSSTTTSTNGEWPSATWGIPLGRCVRSIRSRQDFVRGKPDRLAQLIAMGFVWDVSEYQFRKFFRAIEYYAKNVSTNDAERKKKKALRIPNTFVVPSGQGWPEDLWNYPLGAKCCAIRQKGLFVKNQPDRIAALEEIGFQWSGNASLGWLEVVHAAAIYSQLHGRQLNVPQTFVVPSPAKRYYANSVTSPFVGVTGSREAWPWPEKLWGLKLGQRLKDIRVKGRYLKGKSANARRMQLDALGFVWKPKRGPRQLPQSFMMYDDQQY